MARIQKPGLDYFPLDTDFVRHPIVRRLKKQEGDRALSVLIETLSWLYRNEGYYVRADRDFCEELATDMFDCSADDVQRILNAAAEKGLFHLGMLQQHGILTSADIQRQYLLCVRRRTIIHLNPDFCLLPPEEIPAKIAEEANGSTGINATFTPQNVASGTQSKVKKRKAKQSIENPPLSLPRGEAGTGSGRREEEEAAAETGGQAAQMPAQAPGGTCKETAPAPAPAAQQLVIRLAVQPAGDFQAPAAEQPVPGIQPAACPANPAQTPVAELQRPNIPPGTHPEKPAQTPAAESARPSVPPEMRPAEPAQTPEAEAQRPAVRPAAAARGWTQERIDALAPPSDRRPRNFAGLLDNLRRYHIPPDEQYAIICQSDYGAIGGKVWKGLARLHDSSGKIRLPGRFLLSVLAGRANA